MDKNYWEAYYSQQNQILDASRFAHFIVENFSVAGSSIIDLGCGNGRDTIYFAKKVKHVIGIDQCENEIRFLQNWGRNFDNVKFICADFTSLDDDSKYDIVYSRFTIHSISAEQQNQVLNWAYRNLNENGKFCIEVRGQKNEIFGKGEQVKDEKDAFIFNAHYRRFVNFENFCTELKSIGFTIDYAEEKKGFAPFNNHDETFVRVIARK